MQDCVEQALIADRSAVQSAFLVHAVCSEQQLVAMQLLHEASLQLIAPEHVGAGAPPSPEDEPPEDEPPEDEPPEDEPPEELDDDPNAELTHALTSAQALPRQAEAEAIDASL